jgi:hypothetical protein
MWRWEAHALRVHACFYGVFVIGFGGVLEGAAEAGCCGLCGHFT